MNPTNESIRQGRVVELVSRGGIVEADGERIRCLLRGAQKAGRRTRKNILAVGDQVRFKPLSPEEGVLVEVLPRRNSLSRMASMDRLHQVLAANADQVLVIASVKAPPFRPGMVDRILVAAEAGGLESVICLNKIDQQVQGREKTLDHLVMAGYSVVYTSAVTGEGLDDLRGLLRDKLTVLLGHSGVGKSSLVRCLAPDLDIPIGEVSRKTGRGCHTTTSSRLFALFPGTEVIDTPGMREFRPADVDQGNLAGYFPDLARYADECRFKGCLHDHEPDCAVKEALAQGEIHPLRFRGYRKILFSLGGKEKKGRYFLD